MLTEERKLLILEEVNKRKSATVQELKDELGVSESTIRRDITALSREGRLVKVFGGAVALEKPPSSEELSVLTKESINKDEKLRIGLDEMIYAFDSSTIELCLKLCPWAEFHHGKGAFKMHTLMDLRGSIPTFVLLTP